VVRSQANGDSECPPRTRLEHRVTLCITSVTGWLTWQDSNRQIPFLEMAFEYAAEFRVILPKSARETNPAGAVDSGTCSPCSQ
jgi:hypothetical protein